MTLQHQLDEGSIMRLMGHTQNRNVGIISAFRGRYTKRENLTRSAKMEGEIRGAGYGFYRLEGHYIEGYGSEKEKDVHERSIFVIGKEGEDSGNLKGLLMKLGAKYNQDSILFKPYNDKKAYLIGTQSKNEDGDPVEFPGLGNSVSVGEFQPMKVSQFYSRMKGRPFVFESYEQADNWMSAYAKYIQLKESQQSPG